MVHSSEMIHPCPVVGEGERLGRSWQQSLTPFISGSKVEDGVSGG